MVEKSLDNWVQYGPEGSIADEIVLYLQEDCKYVGAARYAPFFIASLGCHLVNLRNQIGLTPEVCKYRSLETQFYTIEGMSNQDYINGATGYKGVTKTPQTATSTQDFAQALARYRGFQMDGGLPTDLRAHLMYIAPPGRGKSRLLRYFTDPMYGFLVGTPWHIERITDTSTAGLIGTIQQDKKGGTIHVPGLAERHPTAIFTFEEMASLLKTRSDYDVQKVDTLLQILDQPHIKKTLAFGEKEFDQFNTYWGLSQPTADRVHLPHGLLRRILPMKSAPTAHEVLEIERSYDETQGMPWKESGVYAIRYLLAKIWHGLAIRHIEFSKEYRSWIKGLTHDNIDRAWADKLAIGWCAMVSYDFESSPDTLHVHSLHYLREMIHQALTWKYSQSMYGDTLDVLRALGVGQRLSTTQLKWKLVKQLGLDYKNVGPEVARLVDNGILRADERLVGTRGTVKMTTYQVVDSPIVRDVIGFDAAEMSRKDRLDLEEEERKEAIQELQQDIDDADKPKGPTVPKKSVPTEGYA